MIAVSAVGPGSNPGQLFEFWSGGGFVVDVAAPGGNLSSDVDGDGLQDGVFSTWDDDTYLLLQRHLYGDASCGRSAGLDAGTQSRPDRSQYRNAPLKPAA